MKRLLLVCLLLLTPLAHAQRDGGTTVPLCTMPSSDCVVPNWGQVGPDGDGSDASIAPPPGSASMARSTGIDRQVAVQMMPVQSSAKAMTPPSASSVKTVVSPVGLFAAETAALTKALMNARFDRDGTIVRGEEAIRTAAAAAVAKAGRKYALTLYIKVPQKLKPEDGALLAKKIVSVNDVIAGATPKTYPKS